MDCKHVKKGSDDIKRSHYEQSILLNKMIFWDTEKHELTSSVLQLFESVEVCVLTDLDATKETGSVFLMDFPVIPDTDCNAILISD